MARFPEHRWPHLARRGIGPNGEAASERPTDGRWPPARHVPPRVQCVTRSMAPHARIHPRSAQSADRERGRRKSSQPRGGSRPSPPALGKPGRSATSHPQPSQALTQGHAKEVAHGRKCGPGPVPPLARLQRGSPLPTPVVNEGVAVAHPAWTTSSSSTSQASPCSSPSPSGASPPRAIL